MFGEYCVIPEVGIRFPTIVSTVYVRLAECWKKKDKPLRFKKICNTFEMVHSFVATPD